MTSNYQITLYFIFYHLSIFSFTSYSLEYVSIGRNHTGFGFSLRFWLFEGQRVAIFPRCRNFYCFSMFLTSEPVDNPNIWFACKFLIKIFSLWWSCLSFWCLEFPSQNILIKLLLVGAPRGGSNGLALTEWTAHNFLSFRDKIYFPTSKGTKSTWNVR